MRVRQGRQRPLERCVGIVEVFEIDEFRDKCAPLALVIPIENRTRKE